MTWFKRIGLFLAVNFLIVITISLILNVLGVKPYLTKAGLDYGMLAIFCLVWGMGGAFISLALSRVMAKWMMGVKIIPHDTQDHHLRGLVNMVHELARAAGLPAMPEVGIYESPDLNAFATGPTKSRSLVAVSSGLLQRMKTDELRGVLGHEIAHIANGDMVTMTLIQGIVNAFAMFLARVIAFAITMSGNEKEDRESSGPPFSFFIVQFIAEIFLTMLGSIVVAWFSRYREYRADAGGARLAGRESMIHALQALDRSFNTMHPPESSSFQALQISSKPSGFLALFSTHPPLTQRIERLQRGQI